MMMGDNINNSNCYDVRVHEKLKNINFGDNNKILEVR